jgi:hypothetical protein
MFLSILKAKLPCCKLIVNCGINFAQNNWWVMFGQQLCSSCILGSKTFAVAAPTIKQENSREQNYKLYYNIIKNNTLTKEG